MGKEMLERSYSSPMSAGIKDPELFLEQNVNENAKDQEPIANGIMDHDIVLTIKEEKASKKKKKLKKKKNKKKKQHINKIVEEKEAKNGGEIKRPILFVETTRVNNDVEKSNTTRKKKKSSKTPKNTIQNGHKRSKTPIMHRPSRVLSGKRSKTPTSVRRSRGKLVMRKLKLNQQEVKAVVSPRNTSRSNVGTPRQASRRTPRGVRTPRSSRTTPRHITPRKLLSPRQHTPRNDQSTPRCNDSLTPRMDEGFSDLEQGGTTPEQQLKDLLYANDMAVRYPLFPYKRRVVMEKLRKETQVPVKKKKKRRRVKHANVNLPSSVRKLPQPSKKEFLSMYKGNQLEIVDSSTFSLFTNRRTGTQYVLPKEKYILYLKRMQEEKHNRMHRAQLRSTRLNQFSAKYGHDSVVHQEDVIPFTNRIVFSHLKVFVWRFRLYRKLQAIRQIQRWYRQRRVIAHQRSINLICLTQDILRHVWLDGAEVEETIEEPNVKKSLEDAISGNLELYQEAAGLLVDVYHASQVKNQYTLNIQSIVCLQSQYRSQLTLRLSIFYQLNEFARVKKEVMRQYTKLRAPYVQRAMFLYNSKTQNSDSFQSICKEYKRLKKLRQPLMSQKAFDTHVAMVKSQFMTNISKSDFIATLNNVYSPKIRSQYLDEDVLEKQQKKRKRRLRIPSIFSLFKRKKKKNKNKLSTTTPQTPVSPRENATPKSPRDASTTTIPTTFNKFAIAKENRETIPSKSYPEARFSGIPHDKIESMKEQLKLNLPPSSTLNEVVTTPPMSPAGPRPIEPLEEIDDAERDYFTEMYKETYPECKMYSKQEDVPLIVTVPKSMKYVESLDHLPPKHIIDTIVNSMFYPGYSVNRLNWSSVILFKYAINNQKK